MERNGLVIVLLLLFTIALCRSDAFSSRKLVEVSDPNGVSIGNQMRQLKPKDTPNTSPSNMESKGLNDANNKTGSELSNDKILGNGKSQDGKEKVENQKQLETFASKSCKGNPICSDQKKTIIACIQDFESGSNKLTLIVQNEQDTDLKVNITLGTSTDYHLPPFEIHGHGTEKVNITLSGDKSTKVILDAGNGGCELQFDQPNLPTVDNPSNSKDPKITSNPKNVDNPADSHEKPKDVNNPTDNPANPTDANDPEKSKEDNVPVKDNKADTPPNPKEVEDSKQLINVHTPAKSPKEDNNTSKSKDVSQDVNDPSKLKDVDNPSKSKDEKLKDENDPSKSKDENDPSKSKDETDPLPNPTTTIGDTPISQNNILDQLMFYSKQVTPIYGAYFAFLVALIIGASWALCSFRKRRTDNGVPYQELEMGLPESSTAVNVETAEGWDQDWDDDDWDEDKAIRSPGGGIQSKSMSSNGLTSRATKKDGWDARLG